MTVHLEGGGPVSISHTIKYIPNKQASVLRRDSVMLPACLQGYHEVIYDHLAANY